MRQPFAILSCIASSDSTDFVHRGLWKTLQCRGPSAVNDLNPFGFQIRRQLGEALQPVCIVRSNSKVVRVIPKEMPLVGGVHVIPKQDYPLSPKQIRQIDCLIPRVIAVMQAVSTQSRQMPSGFPRQPEFISARYFVFVLVV
jgi:hypothetical protein